MAKQIYGNRYQITEKIGVGGMAEVFKAIDTTLGRTVACKVMLPQYAADNTFAARFRQEAQAAANLQSPYIVNIYDWGRDGDSYYIVMEYVRGTDLKSAIQQRGRIHPRKVAEIGSQVCSALSVAHGYGIIHRDIKSANIMVQADGNVKVMDFGIAQAGNASMTKDSSVLGTAHYVSPEQAQGKELGAESDLYSLGIVMYEAVTGRLPFDGPDVVSVAMKQVNELPIPVREISPEVDPRLELIIMRCLEKNPERRFRTANEMKSALDNYLAGRSVGTAGAPTQVLNTPADDAGATTVIQSQQDSGSSSARKSGKKNKGGGKGRVIIALILVLAAAAAGVAIALNTGTTTEKVSVPSVLEMTQAEAEEELARFDLKLGSISYSTSDTVESGKIMSQDPSANEAVEKGKPVNIVISEGKETARTTEVPNIVGLSASEAERMLTARGLVGDSKTGESDSYEAGLVFEQNPAAFSEVPAGSSVTYTISAGEANKTLTVPAVRGLSEDQATSMLEEQGLIVKVREGTSNEVGAGEVYEQSIAQGTEVTSGTTITIYVAKGSGSSTDTDTDTDDTDTSGGDTYDDDSDDSGYSDDDGSDDDGSDDGSDDTYDDGDESDGSGVRSSDYE